ncbi:MAG: acyl-CoA dehydratase activase [Negativicutes bacterium]|nr:acyl-CoA dehydratase activase [Negativicutes bacterium]
MKETVAGIDVGSTAIKITLYDGTRHASWMEAAGWDPRRAAAGLLNTAAASWGLDAGSLVSVYTTGYGRTGLSFSTKALTEITCHARGAAYLYTDVRTVIDIGGQDAKAIRVEAGGKVTDFIMNDKCAAGTGRFLQVMAQALGLDMSEMIELGAQESIEAQPITSMCAVFAESEVIGLLNHGIPRAAIVAGLYKSIAGRIAAMAARISPCAPVLLTGGVSCHSPLRRELERELKMPVIVPGEAVYAGSIGAALSAWEDLQKGGI